jgi:hypothetical protein
MYKPVWPIETTSLISVVKIEGRYKDEDGDHTFLVMDGQIYEQTSKEITNTLKLSLRRDPVCERHRCALGRPSSIRMPSMIVEISRWESSRVWKGDKWTKGKRYLFDWVMGALKWSTPMESQKQVLNWHKLKSRAQSGLYDHKSVRLTYRTDQTGALKVCDNVNRSDQCVTGLASFSRVAIFWSS